MMKDYYQNRIKQLKERITFFEKLLDEYKKELERCQENLKECEIDDEVYAFKKKLMEENKKCQ